MEYVYCALLGYAVGALNPAYLIGRIKGMDVRENGSGNAGASNAVILFGRVIGVFCALFDIAKAFGAIRFAQWLFPDFAQALAVCGAACILGHIFPFYMKFRGGKGLACMGGLVLAYDWRVFLILLAAEVVVVLVTDYICFVPVTASVAIVAIYLIQTRDWIGAAALALAVAAVIFRHLENFRRIREGKEMRFSYLWHPQQEMKRMQEQNSGESDTKKGP